MSPESRDRVPNSEDISSVLREARSFVRWNRSHEIETIAFLGKNLAEPSKVA